MRKSTRSKPSPRPRPEGHPGRPTGSWDQSVANFRVARENGIGAAVTHRPLPHHRAYGSVHGGSIGYASNPRLTTEDRGTGSKHSIARPRELWTGPSTTDRDRCRRCYPQAAGALPVRAVPRGDDGRFSTVATSRFAVAAGPTE